MKCPGFFAINAVGGSSFLHYSTDSNSTFSGNSASGSGGGIYFLDDSNDFGFAPEMLLTNVTIAKNHGGGAGGGGIDNETGGVVLLNNSIIADNFNGPNSSTTLNDIDGVLIYGSPTT